MGGSSRLLVLLSSRFPRLYPRLFSSHFSRPRYSPLTWLPTAFGSRQFLPFAFYGSCRELPQLAARHMHTPDTVGMNIGETSVAPIYALASFDQWPEWLRLVEHLTAGGFLDRRVSVPLALEEDEDASPASEELPEEFRRLAGACLLYARERPDLLRSLSKRNIEVVVENGSPSLFRNGLSTVRRMKSFVGGDGSQVLVSEKACTVDLMRYLLSFPFNFLAAKEDDKTSCRELVESSIRNLLDEILKFSTGTQEYNLTDTTSMEHSKAYVGTPTTMRQNIEMKKGDWICPRCNFMNFARNMKCLECDETRPKRQLAGGEWDCPKCNFFNYARNMTCLRCDCKRPEDIPLDRKPSFEKLINSGSLDKAEIERRLAESDEKAERWFSKVSQLDGSSDLSSAIDDEDFPEIMPLRKGTNRFVVSNRKTPLERRLANAQYKNGFGNEGSHRGDGSSGRTGSGNMSESEISQTLDRILGRSSAISGTGLPDASGISKDDDRSVSKEPDVTGNRIIPPESKDSAHVSYAPSGMFQNRLHKEVQGSDRMEPAHVNAGHPSSGHFGAVAAADFDNVTMNIDSHVVTKTIEDPSSAAERWSAKSPDLSVNSDRQDEKTENGFQRVPTNAEHSQTAMNRGNHNHFVTPPNYKRRIAMEQASNSNFVPFVPFPPDYFAKKDKQPESFSEKSSTVSPTPASAGNNKSLPKMSGENGTGYSYNPIVSNFGQTGRSGDTWNDGFSRSNSQERKLPQQSWTDNAAASHGGGGFPRDLPATNVNGSGNSEREQIVSDKKVTQSWDHGFPGKSLEGSAVTEPDPLDMSEEAKAQRWFRRVAQIKDISELSNIPDEDFPQIMPMRKGVNRFVISKRKTPLERRLTSPQYRRNLPTVSYEPENEPSKE